MKINSVLTYPFSNTALLKGVSSPSQDTKNVLKLSSDIQLIQKQTNLIRDEKLSPATLPNLNLKLLDTI